MNTQEALDVLQYANKLLKIAELGDQYEISEAIDVLRKAVEWQPMESAPVGRPFVVKHKWTTGNFSIAELVRDEMVISVVDGDCAYNRDGEKQYFRFDELEGWREVE